MVIRLLHHHPDLLLTQALSSSKYQSHRTLLVLAERQSQQETLTLLLASAEDHTRKYLMFLCFCRPTTSLRLRAQNQLVQSSHPTWRSQKEQVYKLTALLFQTRFYNRVPKPIA